MSTKLYTSFGEKGKVSDFIPYQLIEGVLLDYEPISNAKYSHKATIVFQEDHGAGVTLVPVEYQIIERLKDEVSLNGFSIVRKYIIQKVK